MPCSHFSSFSISFHLLCPVFSFYHFHETFPPFSFVCCFSATLQHVSELPADSNIYTMLFSFCLNFTYFAKPTDDNYPCNKTKYFTYFFKAHDILKWKAFWGTHLPGVTCWKVGAFFLFPCRLSFILEQLTRCFWHTDSWRREEHTVPYCRCICATPWT